MNAPPVPGRMPRRASGALAILLTAMPLGAAGPAPLDPSPPSPGRLDSRTAFDRASRAEVAAFVAALGELEARPPAERLRALGLERIDGESVAAWRALTLDRLAQNVRRASTDCGGARASCDPYLTPADLMRWAAAAEAAVPEAGRGEHERRRAFHRAYVVEQVRLAALFPRTTSEILSFSEREKTGFELEDRQFLLTFDDGPTAAGGSTDGVLALLHDGGHNAVFYMLGQRVEVLRAREDPRALRARFAGMCVASHGWTHASHQRLAAWPDSVLAADRTLRETFGPLYRPLFRPPYGQRVPEAGALLAGHGIEITLWNIDSRDWSGLDADDVASRVLRLMLLWRHGVILFHDTHDKARTALPAIWGATEGSGVLWMDCAADE